METKLPFTRDRIAEIVRSYPTPFHIYNEARIIRNARALDQAMKARGFADFQNYFAVKALPNPHIMRLLAHRGQGMDCSSLAELELAAMIGLRGEQIMFSSNNTTKEEFQRATELAAIINFDDISHVEPFLKNFGTPEIACCRYNPGNLSFAEADESIMGKPSEAKYGMPKDQIMEAYRRLKASGVKTFGLHTMLLSNDLVWHNHQRITRELFGLARELHQELGIKFRFINLGGGIGVPYKPGEVAFDLDAFAGSVRQAYDELDLAAIGQPRIVMENGRFITADAGYLVTKVINRKNTYKTYIGVDASMSNLMRPGMYGAYHHLSVLGKETAQPSEVVDVTGSLCENNDKFAIDRDLPPIEICDFITIHTSGAHGHAMGFQYNGKLRSAELLLHSDDTVSCIRRAETTQDYFSTLSGKAVAPLKL